MNQLTHSQIAELVVEAQGGNQEAFATLYTATVDRQLYFATVFLKDSIAAEDVIQEVYISAFKAIPKLQNPKAFVAYLNRICYNACVDHKKKLYPQKFELDDTALLTISDTSTDSTPQDYLELKETSIELQEALSSLPEHQKSAFLLRYYHEMRIREISSQMGISESTVKRYIKAASKALKHYLLKK